MPARILSVLGIGLALLRCLFLELLKEGGTSTMPMLGTLLEMRSMRAHLPSASLTTETSFNRLALPMRPGISRTPSTSVATNKLAGVLHVMPFNEVAHIEHSTGLRYLKCVFAQIMMSV